MSKRKYEDRWQPRSSSQDHIIDLGGGDDDRFCFVSHSSAHKHFAELLCRDLEAAGIRPAFFDWQSGSPAWGEASGAASLEVAAKCGLGILLLSEEFFTASKWPMMQLARMKEYRRRIRTSFMAPAKILPVYYRLNISEFMHYKRQDGWIQHWETMARGDRRINLDAWKAALADIVKHADIHICMAQRMIDDDEGRRIIVDRVTDPRNGFVESGFIRRDAAPPASVRGSLLPGIVHPAVASCAATILQSKAAECSHGVKVTSPTTSADVEESDNEAGNEGSEKDEDSPGRETTPSDSEDAGEDVENMSEEDKEDDDYDVLGDDDGSSNNTDESSSDGDDSG